MSRTLTDIGGFTVLAIPDVSGIHTGHVRYLSSSYKIIVLGLVRREFRRSGVPTSRTLTDSEGSLSWSYRTCPVCMTKGQRLVFKSLEGREFRRKSGVPTVGSSDMCREFRHLTNFNSVTCFSKLLRVRSSDVSREFRHSSGVPTPHNFIVT